MEALKTPTTDPVMDQLVDKMMQHSWATAARAHVQVAITEDEPQALTWLQVVITEALMRKDSDRRAAVVAAINEAIRASDLTLVRS